MTDDSGQRHPLGRVTETLGRLPRYLALARSLLGEPGLSRWRKAALAAGLAYLASPIDLVPGLIPVAGQLDDLAAALLGLRTALRGLSPDAARRHLREVGLEDGDLARDVAIVRGAAGWLARSAARTTAKAGRTAVRVGFRTARVLGRTAALGIRTAAHAAGATRKTP